MLIVFWCVIIREWMLLVVWIVLCNGYEIILFVFFDRIMIFLNSVLWVEVICVEVKFVEGG